MTKPLLYKPEDAAATLGIGRATLYELLARGEITSIKIGRSRRIPSAALEDYAARLDAEQNGTPTE